MSVFENAGTVQQPASTETNGENQDSFVKKLVEVRGEKWSDPEVIAKGKLESDEHIQKLESQLSELREDLNKQDYAKTLLEAIQGKAEQPAAQTPEPTPSGTPEPNTKDEVSIESLVEKAIQEREANQTTAQNIAQAEEALSKAHGTDAPKVLSEKAKSLGMSVERLKELAGESPSAFLTLIGEKTQESTNKTEASTVNSQSNALESNAAKRNFQYYQDLRRKNRKLYFTPSIQNQMFADRQALGDKFFN